MKLLLVILVITMLFVGVAPAHAPIMCKLGAHLVHGECKALGWLKLTLCPKFMFHPGFTYNHLPKFCR